MLMRWASIQKNSNRFHRVDIGHHGKERVVLTELPNDRHEFSGASSVLDCERVQTSRSAVPLQVPRISEASGRAAGLP